MKTNFRMLVLAILVIHMVMFPFLTSNAMAAGEAAAAAAGAGAEAGTAATAGIATGTIAAGVLVATAVAVAVAASGGTTQTTYSQAGNLQNTSPEAATAVSASLGKLEAQTTQDLNSALTVLAPADESALASASAALSPADFATMAGYLKNESSGDLAKQVDRRADIVAWIATLNSAGKTAVNLLFSNVASDTAKLTVVKKLFTGATTAEIPAIQNMFKAAVKSDGTVDTTILNAVVNLVNSIGSGTVADIAAKQGDALKTLLTAQHPGATVTVTVTHVSPGVWTTVSHVK